MFLLWQHKPSSRANSSAVIDTKKKNLSFFPSCFQPKLDVLLLHYCLKSHKCKTIPLCMWQHFNVTFTGSWTAFPSLSSSSKETVLGSQQASRTGNNITTLVACSRSTEEMCEIFRKEHTKLETRPLYSVTWLQKASNCGHTTLLSVHSWVPFILTVLVSVYLKKIPAFLASCTSRRQVSSREAGYVGWATCGRTHIATSHLTVQLCWLCRWVCSLSLPHCKIAEVKFGFN